MFNSLSTRKRKSGKKTKEFLVAERKHDKYLKSMGLDKRTTPPPKSYGIVNDLKVQDSKPIHTMGTPCYKKKRFTTTKTYTIAPAYNKGPSMVVGKKDIKDIGR